MFHSHSLIGREGKRRNESCSLIPLMVPSVVSFPPSLATSHIDASGDLLQAPPQQAAYRFGAGGAGGPVWNTAPGAATAGCQRYVSLA